MRKLKSDTVSLSDFLDEFEASEADVRAWVQHGHLKAVSLDPLLLDRSHVNAVFLNGAEAEFGVGGAPPIQLKWRKEHELRVAKRHVEEARERKRRREEAKQKRLNDPIAMEKFLMRKQAATVRLKAKR